MSDLSPKEAEDLLKVVIDITDDADTRPATPAQREYNKMFRVFFESEIKVRTENQ